MAWKKVNNKKYQIEINEEFVTLDVPYAKVEKLVEAFFANGGMVSESGEVVTSIAVLIKNFGVMGDILRSKYDAKGTLLEDVGCRDLEYTEVTDLFEIASAIISDFIAVISGPSKTEEVKAE